MELTELLDYGIPEKIVNRLSEKGFTDLTRIQEQAVLSGLFEEKSLLISAPTNSGKTFIAELAVINTILTKRKTKTFYLLPLKSLADEKFTDLQSKYSEWGLEVAISTGDRSEFDGTLIDYDLVVATYEKLLVLLVRNEDLISNLGVVIIDEIQNLGDRYRGVNLEILLSLLLVKGPSELQILGLSATVPNASDIANWLNAELVESHIREIDLREGIEYCGEDTITFNEYALENGDFLYKEFNTEAISIEKGLKTNTFGSIIELTKDEQTLVFCKSRADSETISSSLAKHMNSRNVNDYINQLDVISDPTPSSIRLIRSLRNGVAFHHAGLLSTQREIIERAFLNGELQILCSTTTLASGVNTPAKNVIFRSHQLGRQDLPVNYYKNMSGRAGRLFFHDDFGRSILFAKTAKDFESLWNRYILADPEPVESQIPTYGNFNLPLLLIIQFFSCSTSDDILNAIRHTLFGHRLMETDKIVRESFEKTILNQIKELTDNNYLQSVGGKLIISELGTCCINDLISPQTASVFVDLLSKIEGSTESYDDLTKTIIQMACSTFDIQKSSLLYLPRDRRSIVEYARENEHLLIYRNLEIENFFQSVFTTQLMIDWIAGVPYNSLRQYRAHSGQIKRMAETISWVLRGFTNFAQCSIFDFESKFIIYLQQLSERVFFGVRLESLNIIRLQIPGIQRTRAISLSGSGFTTLESLMKATLEELSTVPGINQRVAMSIKVEVDLLLPNENEKRFRIQQRKLIDLALDPNIISGLYELEGDDFVKAFLGICSNHFGLDAIYVGDAQPHDVDGLIKIDEGNIAIEGKRQDSNRVGPVKAEEVWGKGKRHTPIAFVTLGYPDFTSGSIENVPYTGITLLPHYVVADWVIAYYEGTLTPEEILENLRSGEYLGERIITKLSLAD